MAFPPKHKNAILLPVILFLGSILAETGDANVLGVGSIGMTVSDLDRSVEFFSRVLDFKRVSEAEFHKESFDALTGIFGARVRVATMKLGDETIELTEYLTPPGRPIPVDSRSNDRWFQHIAIVVRDMDAAYARMRQFKVRPISTEPQRIPDWNKAAAGIRAFYFRDPDNHALEIICFPPGKGNPRWQQKTEALFLGIDHTAIAIDDTESSLVFYRDVLGLKVVGESVNHGIEQEYLNHVPRSSVQITGLRAPRGPGIELLEYLWPRDGRPYPEDATPNDLLYWQVMLQIDDPKDLYGRLSSNKARFISPSFVEVESPGLSGKKALLVRDPDGHAIMLLEP
jgi:catechol 2,3-dioxygenase-like lactoylglutathione lyase family enzyme